MRLGNREKLELFNNLHTMLSSGVSLLEAVDLLQFETSGNERTLLRQLKKDIEEGKTIASTLALYPDTFDRITVDLLKIGEESGKLETVLQDIEENLKKDIEFMQKIHNAMIYPGFILMVFAGVLVLMFVFVIPRIATVFEKLRIDMPLPTKILVFMSNTFLNYYPLLIGALIIFISAILWLFRARRRQMLSALFSLPGIARMSAEIDVARVTRNIGLMLSSGIPLLSALELAPGVIVQQRVRRVFETVSRYVAEGKTISEAMKIHAAVMTPVAVRMIETGERAGKLEGAFYHVSERFSGKVTRRLEYITTLIEPALMLVISVVVGVMMVAIMAPIYGIIGQIGRR